MGKKKIHSLTENVFYSLYHKGIRRTEIQRKEKKKHNNNTHQGVSSSYFTHTQVGADFGS